jgi:hypothetical protein
MAKHVLTIETISEGACMDVYEILEPFLRRGTITDLRCLTDEAGSSLQQVAVQVTLEGRTYRWTVDDQGRQVIQGEGT